MEIIVVEDGSDKPCQEVVRRYGGKLNVHYFFKENTGPGPTRNYGAGKARGKYLVFFDSDCIVPPGYFTEVERELECSPCDGWGGADRAAGSFTPVQKAINYAMTSFLTTGGIRGRTRTHAPSLDRFYARSFNMGIGREAFEKVGGFSSMRVGEDIDLSARLFAAGYRIRLFPGAWVYHKRRTDFRQFARQVYRFGRARVRLSRIHPGTLKPVHILPSVFTAGTLFCIIFWWACPWLLLLPVVWAVVIFADAAIKNRSIYIGLLSIPASFIQLAGYGTGFISGLFDKK